MTKLRMARILDLHSVREKVSCGCGGSVGRRGRGEGEGRSEVVGYGVGWGARD